MSWAFLADLRIEIPTPAWERIRSTRPADVALACGWSGLKDRGLEADFSRPVSENKTFAEVLRWDLYTARDSLQRIETKGATTSVRIATVLDKSLLDYAHPLATLFEAARAERGSGSFCLVNDGTYSGEDGVELTLTAGKVAKKRITDCWRIVEELGAELFGSGFAQADTVALNPAKGKPKVAINPFTGKPTEVPGKSVATNVATKKTAAKKAATKSVTPKKGAEKKAATKIGAARKATAKRAT